MTPSQEERRTKSPFACYDVRFLLESFVVAVAIVGLAWLGRGQERGSTARVTLGLLQSVAFGFLIVRTLWPIRKLDEFQQRVHLVAIVISFGATGVVVTAAGFLDKAGLSLPLPGLWIWVFMTVVWGVAVLILFRRHR